MEGVPHWSVLVLIMVGAGAFSGITAALWSTERTFRENWLRYAFIGVVASFTVPLFLSTIQSDLIRAPSGVFEPEKYLIFTGLCALAAFYAPSYLKRLSDRILQQLEETKKQAQNAERAALQAGRETKETKEIVAQSQKVVEALEIANSDPPEADASEPDDEDLE